MAFNNAVNAKQSGFQSLSTAGVWAGRTLQQGSGITITNGDGISGDPTISASSGGFVQQVRNSTTSPVTANKVMLSTDAPTTGNTASIMSQAITPTNASNILVVEFMTVFSSSLTTLTNWILFNGSSPIQGVSSSSESNVADYVTFTYTMVAGTTSPITFDMRASGEAGGGGTVITTLQNGTGTGYYGGNCKTQLIVTEYLP